MPSIAADFVVLAGSRRCLLKKGCVRRWSGIATHEGWWKKIKSGEFRTLLRRNVWPASARRSGVRILITGANGQLGCDLQRTLSSHELILMDLPTFDLTKSSCEKQVASARPDLVIHAAAYTDVDGAEHQPDLAMAVNAQGTEWVARGNDES